MEHDKYGDYFGVGETARLVPMFFTVINRMFFNCFIKKIAEVVCHIKKFNNIAVG